MSAAQADTPGAGPAAAPTLLSPAPLTQTTTLRREVAERWGRTVVPINHSETIRVPNAYSEILVGSAEIADVLPLSDRTLYVLGKKIGTTNVSIFDAEKRLLGVMDIEVTPNLSIVETRVRAAAPGAAAVKVSYADGQLILDGRVPDAVTAERVVAIASAFSKAEVINALRVESPQQVLLEVRVLEATREAAREIGIRWETITGRAGRNGAVVGRDALNPGPVSLLPTGASPFANLVASIVSNSSLRIDTIIQALEEKGLARRLAEPNLTAISGGTANFQAGGEFPVPVAGETSNGQRTVTIAFKKFGVMLDFQPTVLASRQINLKLTPEVSELDFTRAIQAAGFTIPAIVVRRATTEVELRDGQSFAIAGLLQHDLVQDTDQLPWLGSVPVLGALFRSQSYRKRETELVILVTARLARPQVAGAKGHTPFDKSLPANDADFFLAGKGEIPKEYQHYVENGAGVQGPYGHVLEIEAGSPPPAVAVAPKPVRKVKPAPQPKVVKP